MAATLWDYSVALVGGKETIYTPLRKRVENVVSAAIWTGSAVTVLGFSLSLSRALSLSLFLSLSLSLSGRTMSRVVTLPARLLGAIFK